MNKKLDALLDTLDDVKNTKEGAANPTVESEKEEKNDTI